MPKSSINIVFQNENFVVCDKPSEVLSVPSRDREDPRPCLGLDLQRELKMKILPVHRLDFEVSGIMLYALNAKAHRIAQNWFEKKVITKNYVAKTARQNFAHWPLDIPTDRNPLPEKVGQEFFWKTRIQRGKRRSFESPHGEWAETKARIVAVTESELQWSLSPLTGKPHQLRLELSRHGFPILGDSLYGSSAPKKSGDGIQLRAISLDLNHISDRLGLPPSICLK